MDKTTMWFIVGFVVIVVVVVIFAGISSGGFATTSSGTPSGFVATTVPPISSADWVRGDATSTVSLIEYGDYECPACEEYEPIMQQLLQSYGDKVSFVFRNFPLYSIHPLAGIAAQAAEAAGLQGKFWEMHDLLYASANWNQWTTATPNDVLSKYFNGYAASLGLDVAKFDADVSASAVTDKIQADVTSGNAASVDHTPTFFVNLTQIPNPASYAEFQTVLDAAIASSTAP
jgi:protein-disulfide isomerase